MSIHVMTLSHFVGLKKVLDAVQMEIDPHQKVALVGKNGSGKSTLLKLIAGELTPDAGTVQTMGKVAVVQQLPPDLHITLTDHLTPPALRQAREHLEAAESLLADPTEENLSLYAKAEEVFRELGGWDFSQRMEQLLSELGLPERQLLSQLSGGQLRRVMLARVMLENADIYLLDEPTNHLDVQGKKTLVQWIRDSSATMVLASHDRAFMDQVATRTLVLERGHLTAFAGGYSKAMQQKQELETAQMRDHQAQSRKVDALTQEVQALKSSARSSNTFNHKRAGNQALIMAKNKAEYAGNQADKQARAMERRVERLREQMPDKPYQDRQQLVIPESLPTQYPNDLVRLEGLDTFCTHNIHLTLKKGMRVALLGENGSGKSTLLKALQSSNPAVLIGSHVKVYFCGQHHEELQQHKTMLDALLYSNPKLKLAEVYNILGHLDLPRDPRMEIAGLSGGERTRLSLACLSVTDAHLLLLDEPTNHLDIQSIEALEDFLLAFGGGMVFASHDQRLVEKVATHTLTLQGQGHVLVDR
ncbi:ABC-F family ATP-binding cassette domain-containing protein [Deinococcus roseus]|uniref:ABC transporter ATP-binding protein n=1 Tax=Deinococcus roseus TaxID=392414 RepID=A0ABQ2CX72_9DEIO|nr:ABC-F family ATP-binding cassette domain-containing protein [Deinococcus roseus]GGJ30088.1 ABC transporter ATP-binding protein [Deinococcus roseus]